MMVLVVYGTVFPSCNFIFKFTKGKRITVYIYVERRSVIDSMVFPLTCELKRNVETLTCFHHANEPAFW